MKLLQSLGGNDDYRLTFAGRGDTDASLKEYALSHNMGNVDFTGFYKEENEAEIVKKCDFINIFFPNDIKHSTIMSNRFYLALIHKKPMIVTAGSIRLLMSGNMLLELL